MMSTRIAPRQSGPHVWKSAEYSDSGEWIRQLDAREIDDLLAASAPFADYAEDELSRISPEQFPLPSLGPYLRELGRRLTAGRGFELIRGFPTHDVPERQAAAVVAGVGAHLGSLRSQNSAGHVLGHVRNVGADASDPNTRIYQTNQRQSFHTDSLDVVVLLCLETGATGGESLLVSVAAMYNEMLARAPEMAALLFEPIATDRRGEVPAGSDPFFTIPVLNWYDDALTVIYQRQYIESAQRFDDAPELTSSVIEALDLFDELANDPDFHIRMQLEAGDMQFVHNHSLLHDRTAFTDKPGSPRHLLRLWLSIPGDRALPPIFAQRFGSTKIGDRGGIIVPQGDTAPLP
jgi:hypothetical protein